MDKKTERIIRAAALVICAVALLAILIHAWKALTSPKTPAASGSASSGTVEAEAQDGMWVEETELETEEDITLSIMEAVLGKAQQRKNLIVFEQSISDIIKVTDEGSLPWGLTSKYQYIKYSGTATYTVDLRGINEEHLSVNENTKTLTIYIPHTEQNLDINEEETQADETENVGIFSIGDLKLTEEARSEVIEDVRQNMEQKLKAEKAAANADRMAKLSVWEIYQPVVTSVSPEYTVVVEFLS
ncbi:MAG: DUF4230 domain-containing protein [Lachnospiraceae bacterium]|nr:DUF4230 domain-containing protein [Lachnospiraceae bacterium]